MSKAHDTSILYFIKESVRHYAESEEQCRDKEQESLV